MMNVAPCFLAEIEETDPWLLSCKLCCVKWYETMTLLYIMGHTSMRTCMCVHTL